MDKNRFLMILAAAVVLIAGYVLVTSSRNAGTGSEQSLLQSQLDEDQVADTGNQHTTDISGVDYNSVPPTSGSHFPVWAKRGVYDQVISDGHLIHSLEHGYIVISYNCSDTDNSGQQLTTMKAGLEGKMSAFTPENPPPVEAELSEEFSNDSCRALVDEMDNFLESFRRVIIVPRPGLDQSIALTAWTRILKLDSINEAQIEGFMKAYHNRGPERTVE